MQEQLLTRFKSVRHMTEFLCKPLICEDYVIQGMEDVSPPKWHLAHTTWFYEFFLFKKWVKDYPFFDPHFLYLFNSYYQAAGSIYPRCHRGLLSRPSVNQIYDYRAHVDAHVVTLLESLTAKDAATMVPIIALGLEHEQQHQELLLMDLKYNFFLHPHPPVYAIKKPTFDAETTDFPLFDSYEGGLVSIGHEGQAFCFDNEQPAHSYFLEPFSLAKRLTTNGEFLAFIEQGGYTNPQFWLADGLDWIEREQIKAPLYWRQTNAGWMQYTLHGVEPLVLSEPVCHVSYFEADAYARFAGCRLPLEEEWEHAAKLKVPRFGNFLESYHFHPLSLQKNHSAAEQLLGDVWEWTQSAYLPYPRYQPWPQALGEYNGKFMINQKVLRGGSCVTPEKHLRVSYRNFFYPDKRWFFSGIRLAKDH